MKKWFDNIFLTKKHVCPWWLAYTWDNKLRRLFHNPDIVIKPYVKSGLRATGLATWPTQSSSTLRMPKTSRRQCITPSVRRTSRLQRARTEIRGSATLLKSDGSANDPGTFYFDELEVKSPSVEDLDWAQRHFKIGSTVEERPREVPFG